MELFVYLGTFNVKSNQPMKNLLLLLILSASIISCKKDGSSIIGTWTVDKVVSSSTFPDGVTKASFGSNGILIISKGSTQQTYNYSAENNVITINGESRHYSCKKDKLELDFAISTTLLINEDATSYLSK